MTLEEVSALLAKCAAYEQRTVGRADIAAWFEVLGHLPFADATQAVTRWYAARRDRMMPSDVIEGCRVIRNERAQAVPHEVRALPSRFEEDPERVDRVRRGVAEVAARWSMPGFDAETDPVLARALERGRRERGKRPVPGMERARDFSRGQPGKIEMPIVPWADPAVRERESVDALHAAGHSCGRSACPACVLDWS